MPKIEKLFAFVVETAPGDEGIVVCGLPGSDQWMPLVGADFARLSSLRELAQQISNATGKKMKILEFSGLNSIGEITPDTGDHRDS